MSKILLVGPWFVSEDRGKIIIRGGTERYIYGLAKQLQNDGYEVIVLSATLNKDDVGFNTWDGLSVYTFKVTVEHYGCSADILSFINTLKLVRRFDPDIVHVIATRYRFAAGAIAAAKIKNVKTVYTRTTRPHRENRRPLAVFFDDWISTRIIKRADIIISLSRDMHDIIEHEIHPEMTMIIPSFTMKSYYMVVEKDTNRILFVGRLAELKGIEFIIESLPFVKREIPEVKLSIAGTGDLLQSLKDLVSKYGLEDNVTFEGHLGDDTLVNMYSKSEIFVFPSLTEGMPMALLEAMSAGLPVVAFDIGPCVEALDDGRCGVLVKKGDVKGLAEKIVELLRDKEQRVYYSRMSMERSKEYSQETVVRRIEGVYSSLIGGRDKDCDA